MFAHAAGAEPRFGHFPYQQAPSSSLAPAGRYRDTGRVVRLRKPAASAFKKMTQSALKDGVRIIPISGFRTVAYQRGLFDRAVKRRGSPEAAAKWVAPPGHSEHHTGWALDLGDASAPETDVDQSFENTRAFAWMKEHAAAHGFELSFPEGNAQGVSYEPWHWRFVGTDAARAAFDPARR